MITSIVAKVICNITSGIIGYKVKAGEKLYFFERQLQCKQITGRVDMCSKFQFLALIIMKQFYSPKLYF